MQRKCTKCGTIKDPNEFNYRNPIKGKLKNICRECEKQYSKDRYKLKRDKMVKQSSDWQERNKDKYLEYQKQYNKLRKK